MKKLFIILLVLLPIFFCVAAKGFGASQVQGNWLSKGGGRMTGPLQVTSGNASMIVQDGGSIGLLS